MRPISNQLVYSIRKQFSRHPLSQPHVPNSQPWLQARMRQPYQACKNPADTDFWYNDLGIDIALTCWYEMLFFLAWLTAVMRRFWQTASTANRQ